MANYRQQEYMRARHVMPSQSRCCSNVAPEFCSDNMPQKSCGCDMPTKSYGCDMSPTPYHDMRSTRPYEDNMCPRNYGSNMSMKPCKDEMPSKSCGNTKPTHSKECDMKKNNMYEGVDKLPLAMAYVPWQTFCNTFDLQKALQVGTIFPELEKPFCGKRGAR